MDNLILFDWLSATHKRPDEIYNCSDDDGSFFKVLLGMEDLQWEVLDGVKGFSKRHYFQGISIHTPSDIMPYSWLEMSGSGCRAYETYGFKDWKFLFTVLLDRKCHIKRLDIAFDDHTGVLDMPTLIQDTLDELYISKATSHEVIIGLDDRTHERSCSIYHGSNQSNTVIRIYDKAKQLDLGKEHWIRSEIQLRDENAENAVVSFFSGIPVGDLYTGILLRYLRYCEPCPTDYNKWRWSLKSYWADLVGDASPIQIASSPGVEYNLSNLENFVFNQAGNAIKTYIDAFGIDKFIDQVKLYKPYITNPKYRKLLEDIKSGDSHV